MSFKKYILTDTQILKIARLCVQEQGSVVGVKAEASQGANLLETNTRYRNKYGDDIYNFFRTSGWYSRASYYMDYGSASQKDITAVRDVLCGGHRVFPQYVDEHDCISDISYIVLNGEKVSKNDKSNYVKDKTKIVNTYGSKYTFYSFPGPGTDPFGYTDSAYEYVKKHGEIKKVRIVTKLPVIKKGDENEFVRLWQYVIGVNDDGIFGNITENKTKELQKKYAITADGIVGAKTWNIGLTNF